MPDESDIRMPCGKKFYCGSTRCRNVPLCASLREGVAYRNGGAGGGGPALKRLSKKPLALPADVVYLYDGSLEGFYCCVYQAVYSGQLPCEIWPEGEAQPSLYQQQFIESCPDKADKVAASIPEKISHRALETVQTVFLSCLQQKELALLKFLMEGYSVGAAVNYMFGHGSVKPVLDAQRHLGGEAHLLKGFVRFSDYDGVLAATISPKNFVLPFLEEHFVCRYPNENFLIYDKTHKAALIYENKQSRIVPLQAIEFPKASEEE